MKTIQQDISYTLDTLNGKNTKIIEIVHDHKYKHEMSLTAKFIPTLLHITQTSFKNSNVET